MKSFGCPQEEQAFGDIDEVQSKLTAFELETLSLILHHWAKQEVVKKRADKWGDKLPKFRSAVIAGEGSGRREKGVPHEIADSEYKIIHHAVRWLQKERNERTSITQLVDWLKNNKVPYEVNFPEIQFTFERPVPLPIEQDTELLGDIIASKYRPSEIARRIVGERLGCSERKIKKASATKTKKRTEISFNQGLLMSIYLDLCSLPERDLPKEQLLKLLNTLYSSGFHLLCIYYMVQRSHAIKKKLFVGYYDLAKVEKLCQIICPESKRLEYEPFLRLT